jgi:hypothetical protein
MSELQKNMTDYFVICVDEFAKRYNISVKDALLYLDKYEGMRFLEEYYDVQHTLSFDETVDNLALICHKHGGELS